MQPIHSSDDGYLLRFHLSEGEGVRSKLEYLNDKLFSQTAFNRYPDPECRKLKQRISVKHSVGVNNVFVGNGLDEVVLMLCLSELQPGKASLSFQAAFPGYRFSTEVVGANAIQVALSEYHVDVDTILSAFNSDVRIIFICNPLNPCGTLIGCGELERLLKSLRSEDTIVVVDEAYIEFAGEEEYSVSKLIKLYPNLVMLRTFSKAFGLAGLRVGYAVGSEKLIARLSVTARCLPFRVSSVAQAAALLALDQDTSLEQVISRTREWITRIEGDLALSSKFKYIKSCTNFVFIRPNDAGWFSEVIDSQKARVRCCSSFGHAGWYRVSVASEEECVRLLAIIRG
ncbi:UNVERIFIED_ORG: histidinol-phosphate aminotransferase [Methylobacterium sp. SuP10 SLI 274]|uniref:pyridoxal phosphate-dependent aminotransferase n=1 Tax=Methylorubrum extorquens TaxID=408 RepID=UPI00209D3DE4|nr:histidinol-phosphate transaminase [Methylorubrum extorquens]MDF9866446.1 histidinol-phosphate aminotransferase [Methylorubrum pseudosasae]MDH6639955.1 histidinol-phosphate aminotransferase [Methylobacterium sp. SuP10 SLI 274]MDH6669323.1 histidinol-phosphate aminotransferase [Methylorubrum zatmanii]MCP1561938.1 histidinol-phosphate aminotransferase [Methylorubrum extorquens]MDF9794717.1 histidinol-phosphate aminotransferase [Methylorubrum extorquens]